MEAAPLPLPDDANPPVCHECGSIVPEFELAQRRLATARHELAVRTHELEQQTDAFVRTARQLSTERGTVKKLRAEHAAGGSEQTLQAMEVAEYWRSLIAPRAREFNGPRLDNTLQRIKAGYPVSELKLAVYGYYCRPYVVDGKRKHVGRPDQRHADLSLIMRDPQHVDVGIAIANQDAKLDVDMVHQGSTMKQALLCDCGHPHADHLRPDLALELGLIDEKAPGVASIPREPCAHKDCKCYTFDTMQRLIDERIQQRLTAPQPPPKAA